MTDMSSRSAPGKRAATPPGAGINVGPFFYFTAFFTRRLLHDIYRAIKKETRRSGFQVLEISNAGVCNSTVFPLFGQHRLKNRRANKTRGFPARDPSRCGFLP